MSLWRQTAFRTSVAATSRFHAFVSSKKHRQVNTTHEYHDVARVHLTVSDSAAMPPQSLTSYSLSILDATGHADSNCRPNNHGPNRKKKVRQKTKFRASRSSARLDTPLSWSRLDPPLSPCSTPRISQTSTVTETVALSEPKQMKADKEHLGSKRAALRGCFAARGLRYTDDAPLPHLLLQKNHGEVLCQGIMNRKSLDNKCASLLKHSLVVTKGSVEEERTLASHDNDHSHDPSHSSHNADFITLLSRDTACSPVHISPRWRSYSTRRRASAHSPFQLF